MLFHLAGLHLGVHLRVVDAAEVGGLDDTAAIGIELEEGLVNHSLSLRVEGAPDAHEELVEVDAAVAVDVEHAQECVGLFLGHVDLDLAEAGEELLRVDLVVAVEGVEVAEGPAEAADRLRATRLKLLLDLVEDLHTRLRHRSEDVV